MRAYQLTHLSDRVLLRDLVALVAQDRATTAAMLAHIAETDARRLYLPAGYDSMYTYCVHELRLSEQAAYRRIQVARTARRFPAVFTALAAGKFHMSAVVMLAPHLNEMNADDLLGAAANKSKKEIELLLARRFPRTEMMPLVCALPASASPPQEQLAPERVVAPAPRSQVSPVAPERFALHLTMEQSTHDRLRYAQSLLSHQVPSGDIAQVLDLALKALIVTLEKRKLAATKRPRAGARRTPTAKRTIPAHVKRAVWKRDRGQCTFVGENGHQCAARRFLEFDHVDPVARGGQATVQGMRLRCRSHNQYEAERTFGAGFMINKRDAARRSRDSVPAALAERDPAAEPTASAKRAPEADSDVMAALRTLGYRTGEARQATAFSEKLSGATLEDRVRLALSYFRPRAVPRNPAVTRVEQVQ